MWSISNRSVQNVIIEFQNNLSRNFPIIQISGMLHYKRLNIQGIPRNWLSFQLKGFWVKDAENIERWNQRKLIGKTTHHFIHIFIELIHILLFNSISRLHWRWKILFRAGVGHLFVPLGQISIFKPKLGHTRLLIFPRHVVCCMGGKWLIFLLCKYNVLSYIRCC